jgi:ribosome-associated toxin RatA of RatAB toxin-antitoxin module
MRELHGTASTEVTAPVENCLALLTAVDSYPDWYPDGVREVDVLERDGGRPTKVRAVLHVEVAGFDRDFDLTMSVDADPKGRVALTKVRADSSDPPFDVVWRVSDDGGTLIELDLTTELPVPRLMPLGGVGDSIARSFVSAARDALA